MERSGAAAYVYAKASGMLSKSFVGKKAASLFAAKSLHELYGLLFKDDVPPVPEALLAKEIEQKAEKNFIADFLRLLESFDKPDAVLISLLHSFDYENLKEIAAALCYRESEMPEIADIGQYAMLSYQFWPDIAGITSKSPVSWYNKIPLPREQQKMDWKLDEQYIRELWASVQSLPASERPVLEDFFRREISYQNIMWVLRLKVFYNMPEFEIEDRLVFEHKDGGRSDRFAGEALSIIEKDPSNFDDWKNWKYAEFLNAHEEGVVWELDPSWVELSFRRDLTQQALHAFHKHPFTAMVLVSWFKIKQHELNCIRTVAEGLRLNADTQEVISAAGESALGR